MNPETYSIATEFLPCKDRQLFSILLHPETVAVKGSVLFLPPFADEMHKSRRTVAVQARALASAGYQVMLLDMSGCGDSSGDFSESTWEAWKSEAAHAVSLLVERSGLPVQLWGLRLGALLACELAGELANISRILMWQPALNGEQFIDQYLRFEMAGRALKGEAGFDRAGLWNQLRSGHSLEVAGYEISSRLAMEIARVRLGALSPGCPITWMDIGAPGRSPSVASGTVIGRWREQGLAVDWQAIAGEAFWRNVDAGPSTELTEATVKAIAQQ